MRIISDIGEMQKTSIDLRSNGASIGFVPTMGALHEGHVALLRTIKPLCDRTVMSIFVNPTQFGPKEDFSLYPRPFEKDCQLAEETGCDYIFAPLAEEMYPEQYSTYVAVEKITSTLEGKIRPTHFKGVTTIVLKFFNIVMPHKAVFGQKDAQQAVIIRRMVADLNVAVELLIVPTVREKDGLALSSRNVYLTSDERREVPLIYQGLCKAGQEHNRGELFAGKLIEYITSIYKKTEMFTPEYIAIVDAETLQPVETLCGKTLIAVACRTRQSNTRLIDNIVLGGAL